MAGQATISHAQIPLLYLIASLFCSDTDGLNAEVTLPTGTMAPPDGYLALITGIKGKYTVPFASTGSLRIPSDDFESTSATMDPATKPAPKSGAANAGVQVTADTQIEALISNGFIPLSFRRYR